MLRNALAVSAALAFVAINFQANASEDVASQGAEIPTQEKVASEDSVKPMQENASSENSENQTKEDTASKDSVNPIEEEAVVFPMSVFTEEQTKAIEDIVHDYLLAHPEILVEVGKKLQQQQLAVQEEHTKQIIDQILNDPDIPMEGDPDAKHYLIEFFDYNCGYCKSARDMMYRLAEETDLKVYYIEMPVLSPMSVRASAIGLALFFQDRDKYLKYQKYLMSQKTHLKEESQIRKAVEYVEADYDKLSKFVNDDPKIQEALRKNMELGDALGMQGVPLFILDGHILRGAVKSYESLKDFLVED